MSKWTTFHLLRKGFSSPCLQYRVPITQIFPTERSTYAELHACAVLQYYSPRFPRKSRVNCIYKVHIHYSQLPTSLCHIIITQLLIINMTTDPLTITLNCMTFSPPVLHGNHMPDRKWEAFSFNILAGVKILKVSEQKVSGTIFCVQLNLFHISSAKDG